MKIEFLTREYLIEHGRRPRGYGWWIFEFEGREFTAHGTLTEAKKACRDEIKRIAPKNYDGWVYVNVCP